MCSVPVVQCGRSTGVRYRQTVEQVTNFRTYHFIAPSSYSAALGNKQYLAVGPLPSHDYTPLIGDKKASPACIQIWSISPPTTAAQNGKTGHQDSGYMRCEMVLCIDIGPAHDLKWCPLPSHDKFRVSGFCRCIVVVLSLCEG